MASVNIPLPFEAYKGTEPYIFVSYAHQDGAAVYPLLKNLHDQGFRVWYDEGIDPGREWTEEVERKLQKAALFLVYMTGNAVESRNVRNEINLAIYESKTCLAVHLEDTKLRYGLALGMGTIQAILKWKMSDEQYQRKLKGALPESLRAPVARQPVIVAAPAAPARRETVVLLPDAPRPAAPAARERAAGAPAAVDLGGGVKLELVWCPAGSFLMGSPAGEVDRIDNETQHRVTLTKGFWMGKFPVTQRQWEAVAGSNPSNFKGADLPVERVSWDDCQAFVKKLNAKASGGGFRLPTEAEWEYACRAGTTTAFCYGDKLDATMANFDGNYPYGGAAKGEYRQTTTAVGSFKPNAWGLCDTHGNVWEWCQDWYGEYPTGSVTDPCGPGSGVYRVFRGGGWRHFARYCRSALRYRNAPGNRRGGLGLRLVRTE